MQAACLIDFITGKDAEIADDLTVLPEEKFSEAVARLCSALQKILLLAFPALTRSSANEMAQRARYWNYRTFDEKIARTAERFGIVLPSADITPVVNTRNKLAHYMRFQTEGNEWEEFARTLFVLDRLLMGLLGYRGPFVDAVTMKRVEPGE